jgi:hypothetical protein
MDKFDIKRIEHFRLLLDDLTDTNLDGIITELKSLGYTDRKTIRKYMKETKNYKMFGYADVIYAKLNGQDVGISEEQKQVFLEMLGLAQISSKKFGILFSYSYSYIVTKFCQIKGYHGPEKYFHVTKEKFLAYDQKFKIICQDLGWDCKRD